MKDTALFGAKMSFNMWQQTKNYYHLLQAFLASILYGFPSKKLTVIGITGTDGKTTTAHMIHHVLKTLGAKSSLISSINAEIGGKTIETGLHVTTPSPFQVQKLLKAAVDSGSEYFVLEATSHGLDQNRLAFVDFDTAVLTNISTEHLDYHQNMNKYTRSKLKLFENVKTSVLNFQDKSFESFSKQISGNLVSYGNSSKSTINPKDWPIKIIIKGDFNLQNAQAAVAVAFSHYFHKKNILSAINSFKGVKGRLEQIDQGQNFKIFVDFAHTPNGLKNVLETLSNEKKDSKLIAVYGSAGERDKAKRVEMGRISAQFADTIILTSEDPRGEDPLQICEDIFEGIKNKKLDSNLFIIENRAKAIELALKMAKKDDIVGIFGKGHEKSMAIGNKEIPWDEFDVVKKTIKKL